MFNVTVIFTRHDEHGLCNSIELLKIIKSIKPDVIFEELLPIAYDQIYIEQSRTTLESDSVKLYLATNVVMHVPVDTFIRPDNYQWSRNKILDTIGENLSYSYGLKKAFEQLFHQTSEGGFIFINSEKYDMLFEDLTKQENIILTERAEDKLFQMNQLRKEVDSKREDVIIDNIYQYGEQDPFHTAILFIGAGHRKSIKSKLDNILSRNGVEIRWDFLDSQARTQHN